MRDGRAKRKPVVSIGLLRRLRSSISGKVRCLRGRFAKEALMGMFDDAMKNAVPGGNLATPIAVALGALILGKMFSGGSAPAPARVPPPAPPQPVPTNAPAGSVMGGLSDLIGKLTAGGAAPQ